MSKRIKNIVELKYKNKNDLMKSDDIINELAKLLNGMVTNVNNEISRQSFEHKSNTRSYLLYVTFGLLII